MQLGHVNAAISGVTILEGSVDWQQSKCIDSSYQLEAVTSCSCHGANAQEIVRDINPSVCFYTFGLMKMRYNVFINEGVHVTQ